MRQARLDTEAPVLFSLSIWELIRCIILSELQDLVAITVPFTAKKISALTF